MDKFDYIIESSGDSRARSVAVDTLTPLTDDGVQAIRETLSVLDNSISPMELELAEAVRMPNSAVSLFEHMLGEFFPGIRGLDHRTTNYAKY